ncbi:MAG TPA: ABC transporter permease [Candidatus Saccharimonadia bacterium]|jgi:ABC-2 type transport system permease protein
MKRFMVLLGKELRELLTPQTILPIVLVILAFIGLGKVLSQQSKVASKPQPVLVVDHDSTPASAAVAKLLKASNFDVTQQASDPDFSQNIAQKAVVVIPAGFGRDLAAGKQTTLETYTVQSGFSLAKIANATLLTGLTAQLNTALAASRIAQIAPRLDPTKVLAPVKNDEHIVANGKVANISPDKIAAYLGSQITFVPVILFIVIVFAGQMVATAMANEKENKTLETLLSLPISRTTIVGAKMLAAAIVAGATAVAYIYGLHSLQSSFTGGVAVDDATKAAASQLGLTLSTSSYVMLGVALFLGILAALAIALVLGAFADNIKSIQALIMPLLLLLLVPYLATMATDIQTLPGWFRGVLYVIPFTYTFQAMPNLYLHNYGLVALGSLYELVFFIVFMVIAGRLFASDRLLTLRPGSLFSRK